MEFSKLMCEQQAHYQYTEGQDDHMLRLPHIEPTNSGHQQVADDQIEHPS